MRPSLLCVLVMGCCRQVATGGHLSLRLAVVIAVEEVLLLHPNSPIVLVTVGTNYCTIEHPWMKHRECALNTRRRTPSPPKQEGHLPASGRRAIPFQSLLVCESDMCNHFILGFQNNHLPNNANK